MCWLAVEFQCIVCEPQHFSPNQHISGPSEALRADVKQLDSKLRNLARDLQTLVKTKLLDSRNGADVVSPSLGCSSYWTVQKNTSLLWFEGNCRCILCRGIGKPQILAFWDMHKHAFEIFWARVWVNQAGVAVEIAADKHLLSSGPSPDFRMKGIGSAHGNPQNRYQMLSSFCSGNWRFVFFLAQVQYSYIFRSHQTFSFGLVHWCHAQAQHKGGNGWIAADCWTGWHIQQFRSLRVPQCHDTVVLRLLL